MTLYCAIDGDAQPFIQTTTSLSLLTILIKYSFKNAYPMTCHAFCQLWILSNQSYQVLPSSLHLTGIG